MSNSSHAPGNRVSPVTASLVSPPKSVALPNVVLSPCANNTHNVASLPFLSVPKVCSVAKPSLQILNQSLNVERLEAIFRSMPTQQDTAIVHKSDYSQNSREESEIVITPCSILVQDIPKLGSAIYERTRSKMPAKNQAATSASPNLKIELSLILLFPCLRSVLPAILQNDPHQNWRAIKLR
ncbi:hypothetical protein HNY73_011562 [Argiope bruennichi]|uniref:Uncharacterized protein n=1 Tax=Argiope bruennichi TaxID=94029 RepID=A0A8T0F472_ARGBR|nr:hypothetical protein HNY73_011562 [Argiope bruennichi]